MYNYYEEPVFQGREGRYYEEYPEYERFGGEAGTFPYYRVISMQEAMNIALGSVPGQVVKIELDQEHGRTIYEVEIINAQGVKYEVDIDSNTGQILTVKPD